MRRRVAEIGLMVFFMLTMLSSCQRRDFSERTSEVHLSLKIKTEVKHNTALELPELMKVALYSEVDGSLLYSDFVGPEGGYIYPQPGHYDLVLYNMDTESTIVRNENNIHTIEAYTNEISSFLMSKLLSFLQQRRAQKASKADSEIIVNEPDHLFVGYYHDVVIPAVSLGEDEVNIVLEVTAESIVETWKIDVGPVEGLEWVSSVKALMTGQVRSNFIAENRRSDEEATIYFEMGKDEEKKILSGKFNTFGKHPDELSLLKLDICIVDLSGKEHFFQYDLTDQFKDNEDFYLNVEESITIQKPTGGGFEPEVDEWEDVNTDIIL